MVSGRLGSARLRLTTPVFVNDGKILSVIAGLDVSYSISMPMPTGVVGLTDATHSACLDPPPFHHDSLFVSYK